MVFHWLENKVLMVLNSISMILMVYIVYQWIFTQ